VEEIGKALPGDARINIPVLFLCGERSGYITDDDAALIKKIFPQSDIKKIPHAGHWLHAENPKSFLEAALRFL
jgi:pimeloyl-ACP methyl ester carboxylesterase